MIYDSETNSTMVNPKIYSLVDEDNPVSITVYAYQDIAEEDTISCYEAWRLPTKKGKGDGRHVICVDKKTLLENIGLIEGKNFYISDFLRNTRIGYKDKRKKYYKF